MNKRISIFVASAFEEKKTLNQTKSYPKTSFCINNTHTQPSMNIIPNSSGERVVVQTEKKRDKYQTRIVFLYNPHYPPYYYYHYYNYYWICNVTLPTHQYNKQKKHKSKQWKNKKHSTQINPTFRRALVIGYVFQVPNAIYFRNLLEKAWYFFFLYETANWRNSNWLDNLSIV